MFIKYTYLHLSGTRSIERSSHSIKDRYDSNGDKEPRKYDRDQDGSPDNAGKCVEEHAEGICNDLIRTDGVYRSVEHTSQ